MTARYYDISSTEDAVRLLSNPLNSDHVNSDDYEHSEDCMKANSSTSNFCPACNTPSNGDANNICLSGNEYHHYQSTQKYSNNSSRVRLILVMCLSLFFMGAEIIGGYIAGSLAVVTDGAHLVTDLIGFLISLIALSSSKRKNSKRFNFGFYRIEILATLISILLIWIMTGIFIYLAVMRLFRYDYEIDVDLMILISCLGVVINIVSCQSLSKYCPKLQKLDIGSCPAITDISLKYLSEGCNHLTHINISWCDRITENGVEALARGCPKLKSFISKGCVLINDKAVSCLAKYCPNLEVVNLHGCSNIQDEAVQHLSENCPKLHYLCLSQCSHLTDNSLLMLAHLCPNLSTLEVAGCSQFTDIGFQALARSCRLLEKMDLEECALITDATLIHLAMGCPRLEKLSLSHCELITDEGIRHLGASQCAAENLTVLELDNCPLITDASLDHLVSCSNLQRIELYDCQLITRAGIRRLRNHLPGILVQAYFAPVTPPPANNTARHGYCRCCVIL